MSLTPKDLLNIAMMERLDAMFQYGEDAAEKKWRKKKQLDQENTQYDLNTLETHQKKNPMEDLND